MVVQQRNNPISAKRGRKRIPGEVTEIELAKWNLLTTLTLQMTGAEVFAHLLTCTLLSVMH